MTEVALASDDTPHTPALIAQLLEKLGLPLKERGEQGALNPEQRVQAVLLEDAVGALLVLYPRSQMLSLIHI